MQLVSDNAELEARVAERTAELEASRSALAESERQLRAFALRLLGIREEKRTQLAREIHDVLGQELTGLKMDAAWLLRRTRQTQQDLVPVRERLQTMVDAIDNMSGIVRDIVTDLRPSVLDDLGLAAAIESYALDFGRRSGLEITLDLPDDLDVERALATALFRVVQELFTNIARHAGARSVALSLRRCTGDLELRVLDDGAGIARATAIQSESFGLAGIRERVLAFRGTFAIGGRAGRNGTEAIVWIPRAREQAA